MPTEEKVGTRVAELSAARAGDCSSTVVESTPIPIRAAINRARGRFTYWPPGGSGHAEGEAQRGAAAGSGQELSIRHRLRWQKDTRRNSRCVWVRLLLVGTRQM